MKKTFTMTIGALAICACEKSDTKRNEPPPPLPRHTTVLPEVPMPDLSAAKEKLKEMTETTKLDRDDAEFVEKAASGGMFEIESSRYMLTQTLTALSTEWKQLAQMMVTDHQAAADQLKALADKKGWKLPEKMIRDHQKLLEDIKKAPADKLVKTYQKIQLDAHEDTVKMFEKCEKDCKDADLKAFAGKVLPTIKKHLEHLKKHAPTASISRGMPNFGLGH